MWKMRPTIAVVRRWRRDLALSFVMLNPRVNVNELEADVVNWVHSRGVGEIEGTHKRFVEGYVGCGYAVNEKDAEKEWRRFCRMMARRRFALADTLVSRIDDARIKIPTLAIERWRRCWGWLRLNWKEILVALAAVATIVSAIIQAGRR